jgi:predicted RNase H-like nuclease (RuvC/YqgF family)
MTENEVNSIKIDVALIKSDINQIQGVFRKVDHAVEQMSDIYKTLAVQEKILENNDRRITGLENKMREIHEEEVEYRKELTKKLEDMTQNANAERERRHKEVLESISKMNDNLQKRNNEQDERITKLENWKWYMMGAVAVIVFIITEFPWSMLFGG